MESFALQGCFLFNCLCLPRILAGVSSVASCATSTQSLMSLVNIPLKENKESKDKRNFYWRKSKLDVGIHVIPDLRLLGKLEMLL